jgi:hypothetical protein
MMPLRAIESMTGPAAFSAAAASSFLPARTASTTLRTALLTFERCATLRPRLATALRARFSADFVLAIRARIVRMRTRIVNAV